MKLHLGCGQRYLDGYVNIDYPLDQHNVQIKTVADKHADLTKLQYRLNSINEVRLHHVFEHFERAIACALLLTWRSWLKKEGIIRIEVPDFKRTTLSVMSPFSSKRKKAVGLRHVFGSQEANWAIHYHGWSAIDLRHLLKLSGFEDTKLSKNNWKGTYNVEILAKKNSQNISKNKAIIICEDWLRSFLVDNSPSEKSMHKYWTTKAQEQINICWGK